MIKLTLTEKGGEPKLLTFDKDEITIGRVTGNDIVLAKGNVSKRHSRFAVRNGQVEVSDLKSTNGTFVNGRKIAGATPLGPADRVYVGDFLIGIEGAPVENFGLEGPPTGSAARRMPIPPPPPPPRGGSSAARLPANEDEDPAFGGASAGEEDDDLGLAARPPRSGRMPIPPPPPPPRRPPTPLASRALADSFEDGFAAGGVPAIAAAAPAEEDTGNVGLFANARPSADEESAGRRAHAVRPGVPAAAAPAFGVAGASEGAAGLEALLADPAVTQILITAPDAVLVDRGAGLGLHAETLGDPNAVADALWRLANTAFPPPAPDNPVVDVRLADGTRVAAAFPPASPSGVVASIRRPVLGERAIADLVPGAGKEALTLFEAAIAARRNLLITGDPGVISQALGALSAAIPADRRVVAIGASLPRGRGGWMDLAPTADMAGLVRVASVLRPDHLLLGELGGPEIGELLLVATRGQEGLAIGLGGRSPGEALGRLAALASAALGAPAAAAAALVAGTFDLVVHIVATSDGRARIVEVAEPKPDGASVGTEVVLAYYGDGSRREPGSGRLQGRGVSARLGAAFAAAGHPLPASLVGK